MTRKKTGIHVDKDLVDFVLSYAAGKEVEYAEVRAHSEKSEGLVLKNGALDTYFSAVDSGFCVRILAEGGIGFASTNKWTRIDWQRWPNGRIKSLSLKNEVLG
jgi:predicted Zn-dependent protease